MLAPLVYALLNQHWLAAAACYVVAVITDIYDGKLARKLNQSSPLGGVLDHLTDALIVTAGCWCLAKLGLINSFLPWIIALAFVQYMLDSKALAGCLAQNKSTRTLQRHRLLHFARHRYQRLYTPLARAFHRCFF